MINQAGGDFTAIVNGYSLLEPIRIEREDSGMNNTTRMIYTANDRFVLRVYDNHSDETIVGIEHAILTELQQAALSFKVPNPISNRAGGTVTKQQGGKLAALFGYIAGDRPSIEIPSHIETLGRAAGELSQRLADREQLGTFKALAPVYQPYYEMEEAHAAMGEEAIRALSASLLLTMEQQDKITRLLETRNQLTTLTDRIKALPHQWIHGDIVFANALAQGDAIVGLLDFEFCTIDVRVMELAVILAEFPCEDKALALQRMALICRGFKTGAQFSLDHEEIQLLPDLMQLRMLDVWLHFAGRLAAGLDAENVWLQEIERAAFVCGWVDRQRDQLQAVFQLMGEPRHFA